jgi:hypothetical protein
MQAELDKVSKERNMWMSRYLRGTAKGIDLPLHHSLILTPIYSDNIHSDNEATVKDLTAFFAVCCDDIIHGDLWLEQELSSSHHRDPVFT